MRNWFCKKPLWEVSKVLSAVAQGKVPADLVVRDARLVNVCTGEIQEHMDVAVKEGRIALVGDGSACVGEDTRVLDAQGQFLAPGFLDGHIHVESSMLTVGEYARAVLPHGTVGIYMDPHEICNVLGLRGVALMAEDAARTPLKAMITTPSCVPAVPGFEDSGAQLSPEEVEETMAWESVVGLGEMMNFPGILNSQDRDHGMVDVTLRAGKIPTGHYSMPETGSGLNAYVASGVRCCHESTRMEDALAKMRLGMYAFFREGSAWHDLEQLAPAVTGHEVDTRFAGLCSDDTHPNTLVEQGHLDHILRRAVEEGIDPVTAVQMVTINCAQCFQMDHDLGSIAPGKCADMVFLEDLKDFKVTRVLVDGDIVAEDGIFLGELPPYDYPAWAKDTMHVAGEITEDSFRIPAQGERGAVRVIEVIPARVGSYERHLTLPVREGAVCADPGQDVLKAVVFERHHGTGKKGVGFVKGFGIQGGAMASTVAHDAHNLLVVGVNDRDMALAANTLVSCGGGHCVVKDGKVLGCVPLPIAGLMSGKGVSEMARLVAGLEDAWREIGCGMPSPFMTMALLPLACLPELRLTDRGLVDCTSFQFVPLFV